MIPRHFHTVAYIHVQKTQTHEYREREREQNMYSKDRYFTKQQAIFNEMKCTFQEEKKYKFRGIENVNTLASEVLMKRGRRECIQKHVRIWY